MGWVARLFRSGECLDSGMLFSKIGSGALFSLLTVGHAIQ